MSNTILLADDSRTIHQMVAIVFEKEPYDLVSVVNGEDAVQKARELLPVVVLADHVMPGMTGYDVAASLSTDPSTAHIPVILLSGSAAPFDGPRAQSAGIAGNVDKPFDCKT